MTISPEPRVVCSETLLALRKKESRVVVLKKDLAKPTRSVLLHTTFPKRYSKKGIAM